MTTLRHERPFDKKALPDELSGRIKTIIKSGWVKMRDHQSCRGFGGPGKHLEYLLGIDGGNRPTPDAGGIEIKFHGGGGGSLITLCNVEPEFCQGNLRDLVKQFGNTDGQETSLQTNIRHTPSDGFYLQKDTDRLTIVHSSMPDSVIGYWMQDDINQAFDRKLWQLIVVTGQRDKEWVRYESARWFHQPKEACFVDAIEKGIITIEFGARIERDGRLRNHGTRFRVKNDDLPRLYPAMQIITDPIQNQLL